VDVDVAAAIVGGATLEAVDEAMAEAEEEAAEGLMAVIEEEVAFVVAKEEDSEAETEEAVSAADVEALKARRCFGEHTTSNLGSIFNSLAVAGAISPSPMRKSPSLRMRWSKAIYLRH
tara:strand:- start:21672 stop:22025 length:354 start_codon:yes stop_codon:yes gene_type:complete